MTYARKTQISLKETPYYHVIGRCVRRAWLWGAISTRVEPLKYVLYPAPFVHPCTSDYQHRKTWVTDRLRELDRVFAIQTCAFAVMSNHYHLVVYVDQDRAKQWSDAEVARRWKKIFGQPTLVRNYLSGKAISNAEADVARTLLKKWRARLMDVSWYMH
jgi:hypothetical protein